MAAIEHLSLPYDPATRRLFGVPVTTSNAQAAGVRHVIASGAVALDTDTRGVDVQWSENATADSVGRNLVFARCESRYATSGFSPLGLVTLDLTPEPGSAGPGRFLNCTVAPRTPQACRPLGRATGDGSRCAVPAGLWGLGWHSIGRPPRPADLPQRVWAAVIWCCQRSAVW